MPPVARTADPIDPIKPNVSKAAFTIALLLPSSVAIFTGEYACAGPTPGLGVMDANMLRPVVFGRYVPITSMYGGDGAGRGEQRKCK